jgi:NADPH-dependent curcumin reductase CurA
VLPFPAREGNEQRHRQWLLVRRSEGNIREDDFRFVESPIPTLDQGQVLVRNLWLSFDPTQSGWMRRDTYILMIPLGDVMRAASVGQVIQSRHPGYKPGEPSERLRQAARERSGGDVAVNGSRRSSGRGVDFWQSA